MYITENNKKERECIVKALEKESNFRDRKNSLELEKLLEELNSNQKSDEYFKMEGCGGELRNRETVEESSMHYVNENREDEKGDNIRRRFDRRQSSIIGFDEPFPFKSLKDFLPSFDVDEDVRMQIFCFFFSYVSREQLGDSSF